MTLSAACVACEARPDDVGLQWSNASVRRGPSMLGTYYGISVELERSAKTEYL